MTDTEQATTSHATCGEQSEHPGKFEGEPQYAESHLYEWSMESAATDTVYGGEYGTTYELFVGPFDCPAMESYAYLTWTSDSGFFNTQAIDSESEYADTLAKLEREATESEGPQDDDITINEHGHAYQNGELISDAIESSDLDAAIRAHMETTKYWPNVWTISDHGNASLYELD